MQYRAGILLFALIAVLTPAHPSLAADYPTKPITLINPNAPGGGHDAVAREHLAHPADAADIRVAVFLAEAQPFAQVRPHDVPVQHFHLQPSSAQFGFYDLRYCALARPGQAREPEDETLCHFAAP